MRRTLSILALSLALATPAMPTPADAHWQSLDPLKPGGKRKCRRCIERLKFLQALFPGATDYPANCQIAIIEHQPFRKENLVFICEDPFLLYGDGPGATFPPEEE